MLFRRSIIYLALVMAFLGLLGCSSKPVQLGELSEDEVGTIIQNDIAVVLDHLDSLAKTHYGKNYLADLLVQDSELSCEMVWYEDRQEVIKTLGTSREVYRSVTREQVNKALFHRVTLSIGYVSGSGRVGLGTWAIFPDGKILPSPIALRLEAELVK